MEEAVCKKVLRAAIKGIAYAGRRGAKWCTVIGGVEGKMYDKIGVLRYSQDGKHLAYAAKLGEKWRLVVDGIEGKEYKGVCGYCFSNDGKRMAYTAQRGEKWFVVMCCLSWKWTITEIRCIVRGYG